MALGEVLGERVYLRFGVEEVVGGRNVWWIGEGLGRVGGLVEED